ncbi:MAG TPA: ATP synthase F1 subunit gamma [Verrucomicrobiae bacterium]|jgi:F-type H+-transporting ATPase subunit gamma|nr:ATP synthase F1 subunit gamma [Verrucomicrobiae bacterium]
MSGQLRELKNRIRSVENTKKITRAMEMVAAAKLRRFQTLMVNARPYTEGIESLVRRLFDAQKTAQQKGKKKAAEFTHPFFEKREEKKIALLVMTSDTGLCGSYNTDLVNLAKKFIGERKVTGQPLLVGIGKSGITGLQRAGFKFERTYTDVRASRVEEILKDFKQYLEEIYSQGKVDAIYVVYSHFLTLSQFHGVAEKLLPLEAPTQKEGQKPAASSVEYIFEPSREAILGQLIPQYFEAKTRMMFLESMVSEQIARMNAMHQATDNAKEMIESLVLQRNKARQASITKEIIEIVSGSRALKIK